MAIERIPYGEALPVSTQDYVRQNNLLETGFLRVNDPWPIAGGNIVKGAVFQIGGTVYLATSNTAIGGAASDYVKLTPSGDGSTCAADYVANLAGVSWDDTYNGYYDVGGNLYVFNEALAVAAGEIASYHIRYLNIDENGRIGGNISLRGSSDADRQIDFASDAAIQWDESDNIFRHSKNYGINIHSNAGFTDDFVNAILPYFPNEGDIRFATGFHTFGASDWVISKIERRPDAGGFQIFWLYGGIVSTMNASSQQITNQFHQAGKYSITVFV
jgi:hypothetical protein